MKNALGWLFVGVVIFLAFLLHMANARRSTAVALGEAQNIARVEQIGEMQLIPSSEYVELTTRDLFEVEWNKEKHECVGTYREHLIYTDRFRVWWESRDEDENGEDVYTWTEATEVIGVYLGNQKMVHVLIDEDEEEHIAYRICLHRDVDRLDVLDEDNNRIVSLR